MAPIKPLGATLAFPLLILSLLAQQCCASVTVWYLEGQSPIATTVGASTTAAADPATYTGLEAYSPVQLTAPPPPGPSALPTNFTIQMSSTVPTGASIPQSGAFFGFSIEMSVVNQVLGKNASLLQVPFLNLMGNLQSRVGRINIRVGGNTQETATLVPSTPDGRILEKDLAGITNPTETPPLIFTPELLYMLRNISSLINIRWHLGVPFNDTTNFRLAIVEQGEAILGDYLIGMQAGNEPDLYVNHGHRPDNYTQFDYFGEFGQLIYAVGNDTNIPTKNLLIGPSVSTNWTPEAVWNTGFVDAYSESLAFLSVEHYPSDNCGVAFPNSNIQVQDPQALYPVYLSHSASTGQLGVAKYVNSTQFAQTKGKELLMFETNTASCGGFPGLSDSFGAALWGVDYAMQMAAVNFSGALFHVGGQSVSYNPFTPPPTNQSTFHQWTIGPIYYSALVVAEALGPTNTSRVIDLQANANNDFSPGYGIWENGALARVLLINFASDNSTASDLFVNLTLQDGQMPASVNVKYLQAASVNQKGNLTWAGQTFGEIFQSDGRPMGTESLVSVPCTTSTAADGTTTNVCTIKVPAPAAALVFLSDSATPDTAAAPSTTFATTTVTKAHNTVTVDPSVLATSNGHSGLGDIVNGLGSTSAGALKNGATSERRVGIVGDAMVACVALVAGWWAVRTTLIW